MDGELFGPLRLDMSASAKSKHRSPVRNGQLTAMEEGSNRAPNSLPEPTFFPLVEEDELFFRIVPRPTAVLSQEDGTKRTAAIRDLFRESFVKIWERIPEDDRQIMLDFWHDTRNASLTGIRINTFPHLPMIQVVDSGPLSVRAALLDKGGLDMTFFATLASKKRNLVPVGIVEGLIRVLRLVTRVHWPLFMKMVEEPFEMWRKEHEATVTDEDEQEHYDSLVAAYRSTVEQEKMAIQKRWGFEELQTGVLQRPPETTE